MDQEKDVRYYRTKERIIEAMIRLLKEKQFDQITVKDICKYAEVSRSGFYLHYLDKYDLAEKYQLEFIGHINKTLHNLAQTNKNEKVFMLHVLYYLKNEGQLLALLISDHGSSEIQNQVKQIIKINALENVLSYINIQLETESEKNYLATFLSSAVFGVLQEWIHNGQKESPEVLVKMISKIINFNII